MNILGPIVSLPFTAAPQLSSIGGGTLPAGWSLSTVTFSTHELFFQYAGEIVFHLNGNDALLRPGTFFFLKPGDVLAAETLGHSFSYACAHFHMAQTM